VTDGASETGGSPGLLDRIKRRQPVAFVLDVNQRFGELGGGFLASAVTLTFFLSLFPMLLVAVAVLGFLSINDAGLAADAVERMGLTGDAATTVTEAFESAEDSRAATSVIGFLGLLWTSIGLVGALAHVCNRPWQVAEPGLRGKLKAVGWLLAGIVLLGAAIGVTALLSVLPSWLAPVQILAGVALLGVFLLFTFRLLTEAPLPWRAHLPGAVVGAIGLQVLTFLGAVEVPRQVASSSAIYGTIGVVFAVLAWLLLFGRLLVYAVVVNVVRYERVHGTRTARVELPGFADDGPHEVDRAAVAHPA
jgi:membrane protein